MVMPNNIYNFAKQNGWLECFESFFVSKSGHKLLQFLSELVRNKTVFYPHTAYIFRVFKDINAKDIKVIILGQDPYHGEDQSIGLAFAVKNNTFRPPSLRNIFKELKLDMGIDPHPADNDLTGWTQQGVMLLNSILTVEHAMPGSHKDKGWEEFTSHVVQYILDHNKPVVVCLWGEYAKKRFQNITIPNNINYLVLKSTHPSPFSAHKGFIGCGHFSKINTFLDTQGCDIIDWNNVSITGRKKPDIFEYLESHQQKGENNE